MGRRPRIDVDDGWHHVMNRGAGRHPTFIVRSDGATFERLIGDGHEQFGVEVHAYCLMGNHFHLLLHCPAGGLSKFMQHLSANYTRVFNERHGRDGPLFRGRFHSLLVHDARYALTATRYIHRNPVDIRPPVDLAEYRWSSHAAYLGRRRRPEWLRTEYVLGMLDGGVAGFHEFVVSDLAGGAASVPPDHVLDLLELATAEQLEGSVVASSKLTRTIAIGLLDRVGQDAAQSIERALDFTDRRARTEALRKAAARFGSSSDLIALLDSVRHRIA